MNRILILFSTIFFLVSVVNGQDEDKPENNQLMQQWLNNLSDVTFDTIAHHPHFKEAFLLQFEQPIDHNDPDGPSFSQRVFLFHHDFPKPVVLVTEGYAARYAENPAFIYELSDYLDANQIIVEHRYFGESVPDSIQWEYLTVEQAANDHHRVVELFKGLYRGKWLNTGISKGGQTAMYHRYFFPEDVDVTIGYVCPLNFSIEDARVYSFMELVGDSICRNKVFNYQMEMLQDKAI
ncbi:MAG: hypothetical protein KAG99_03420, partial [Bacteroidales bacterium]|nr:hypothetical protein [Bacteroidales bacterium]